jgi:hypothetical protein
MKKSIIPALLIAAASFTSCGTTGSTSSTSSSVLGTVASGLLSGTTTGSSSTGSTVASLAGLLLNNLLSSSATLSQDNIVGTWTYSEPSCVFESENFLAKAGGAVASNKIESQLATQLNKVGIKKGSCTFTFNKDNTYTATIGGKTLSGTYTLDSSNKTIKMTYLAGIGSMTPKVSLSGNTLSLLFESKKVLSLVQSVSKLSSNSTVSTLSSLLSNYSGMYVGMKMTK